MIIMKCENNLFKIVIEKQFEEKFRERITNIDVFSADGRIVIVIDRAFAWR